MPSGGPQCSPDGLAWRSLILVALLFEVLSAATSGLYLKKLPLRQSPGFLFDMSILVSLVVWTVDILMLSLAFLDLGCVGGA